MPYLVGLGLAVVVEFDVLVDVFTLPVLALVVVVVVVVVVAVLAPVFDVDAVLLIVEVLLAIVDVFALLVLLAVVLSLPPQAAPSAPIARTAESAITFFIT